MVPPFFADIGRHGPLPLRCKRMGGPRFHFEKTRRGGGLPLPSYNKGRDPSLYRSKNKGTLSFSKERKGCPSPLKGQRGNPSLYLKNKERRASFQNTQEGSGLPLLSQNKGRPLFPSPVERTEGHPSPQKTNQGGVRALHFP